MLSARSSNERCLAIEDAIDLITSAPWPIAVPAALGARSLQLDIDHNARGRAALKEHNVRVIDKIVPLTPAQPELKQGPMQKVEITQVTECPDDPALRCSRCILQQECGQTIIFKLGGPTP